ncbi:MAG: hypothetical protein A2126_02815 [Candidatus Woykebacteria bacterium GWB1_45_5]|uniref:Uncharacterized protein n=2 Tax=Candidatus Woykeibacteriota TaxID=1817899 RepID=A0A1G1VZW3_9BACT|nr:MAG: hypothetical protein A2113_01455 [Candidatus Woykebacteria bacterium GWA1_44_8]OGY24749.1 MAG: hypothetical protein A2126_02815 [Candidatus Woykebacteria bacterium GWB1_45_5]
MSKFAKTLIGFVTITVVLSLFTAGGALILILASIVCTAGVSLVIWIPLSYGVGSLIVGLLQGQRIIVQEAKVETAGPGTGPKMPITNEEVALTNYVKQARACGMPASEIAANLKEKGWSEELRMKVLSESFEY